MTQDDTNTAIMALHDYGFPTRSIATIIGSLTWSGVARRLKKLTPRKSTEIFKFYRADILAEKQRRLLMQSNKVGANEQSKIAIAFGVYYDKERLERNQSTANMAIQHGISVELAELVTSITGGKPVDKPVDNCPFG